MGSEDWDLEKGVEEVITSEEIGDQFQLQARLESRVTPANGIFEPTKGQDASRSTNHSSTVVQNQSEIPFGSSCSWEAKNETDN